MMPGIQEFMSNEQKGLWELFGLPLEGEDDSSAPHFSDLLDRCLSNSLKQVIISHYFEIWTGLSWLVLLIHVLSAGAEMPRWLCHSYIRCLP